MASDTPSGPKSGSSNNSTSSGTPSPPASPPPSPPASPPPPPTPTSSPPPSPPASPPPAPPQSPPPSPPHHSSSQPPPTSKQPSPASPPPPEKSDSPTPPKNSQSSPEGSTPPSPLSPQSSGTPSPPSQLVSTPPPPNASTAGSVFSPPHPISESTPETPATHASSTNNHSPPSHSPPHAKGSTNSSSSNHLSSPQSSGSLSSTEAGVIGGLVVAGIFVIAFIIICVACSRRKRKRQYYFDPNPRPNDQFYNGAVQPHDHVVKLSPGGANNGWGAPPPPPSGNISSEFNSSGQHQGQNLPPASPKMGGLGGFNQSQFTYEELAAATGGFSQSNLIGQGGFGFVHKGVLSDKREVAVKSLKSGSGQGEREFQAEVDIISRVHHRHLVSLFGYCITDQQRMLVYEFVPNNTLEFHLHGTGNPPMDWSTRLRIALGSAKGLAYLHEDCHPRIIHRDIKAANILLDANFEAMVADFGLAKLTSDNYTHVSTRVMGTFGYLAPEYAQSGKLTEKSDVFSFGVMLLELITGRRPVDTSNRMMEDSLVDWARPLLTKALEDGNYDELADPRLEGNYVPHEMARMVACASASIRHSARRRPRMSQIVRSLQGDSALEELNEGAKPGNSSAYSTTGTNIGYDTGAYNADMMKFRKMIMPSQEFTSGECGATSEYGLNPSSSSSDGYSGPQKHK